MNFKFQLRGSKKIQARVYNDEFEFLKAHKAERVKWYRVDKGIRVVLVRCQDCNSFHIDGTYGNCR